MLPFLDDNSRHATMARNLRMKQNAKADIYRVSGQGKMTLGAERSMKA